MMQENVSPSPELSIDYKAAFEALPGCFILLELNKPFFTIRAISDQLLRITSKTRETVYGKSFWEIFPPSPLALTDSTHGGLDTTLHQIIQENAPDQQLENLYHVRLREESAEERYWSITCKPIINNVQQVSYVILSITDVTSKIEAEKKQFAIKNIEKTYDIFMQAPVALCLVTGPENLVEFANPEMLRLLDRTPDLVGQPFFEAIREVKNQGFPELLEQVRLTGKPFLATEHPATLLINGKEEEGYYNFIYQPYFKNSSDNTPSGVFIVAHSVTELVKARKKEEEVKDYLNFRNALFEAQNQVTPDGVLIVDAKGKMLLHNQRFVDIWQMPQEIINSQDDAAALQHAKTLLVDPQGYIDRVNTLYARQSEPDFDQILFKDGRVIERHGNPIVGNDGVYYGWAWYFRDVTDRIRQEQKFRNVVEQAPGPILILKGEELRLEVANQALLDLWQVGPESLNQPFLDILPEMKEQGVDQLLIRVMHTGEGFQGYEMPFVFKRKSGLNETRFFNFYYHPYREADNSITGVLVIASDVTGQVLVKQQLAESELRFQNLVMAAPVAIAVFRGHDFIAEIVNDAYLPLVGKTREEFAGKPLFESLPEAREALEPLARELVRTGKSFPAQEFEIVLNRYGKPETCYFNSVWQPLYESDGKINGFMVVAHEITEQVVARKKVEASEQQVRSFVQSAPLPIGVYVGKEMRIQFANQAIIDAWGKSNDVIGKRYADLLPELIGQDILNQLDNVFTTGKPFQAKNQKIEIEKKGERHTQYYNYNFTPLFQPDGTIYGVMNTAADVTDLMVARQKIEAFAAEIKESEQRFRIMADAAPNLVWALNPDSSVRYVNKVFLDFLGISLDQFISQNWVPYMHPDDLSITEKMITEAISEMKIFAMEHRMRRNDGTYRWLLSQGAPSYYQNGELYGYVGSAIDITNLKEAEEALANQNVQLTRINKDLDNFVYTASHDLRTPITNIEALTQVLKDELQETNCLNTNTEEILNHVIQSVNRFKSTINDLSEISRLQKNLNDGLKEETLHIPDIYAEILADMSHYQQGKACEITTDFQEPLLTFSRKNFRSILYNLLSNAIKYQALNRPGTIHIDTRQAEGCLVLRIKDNGLGMTKQQQAKLYTMFKRFHDHVEGTGIGLFMVKRIVENAGGDIQVESNEGEGTEFKVFFKLLNLKPE